MAKHQFDNEAAKKLPLDQRGVNPLEHVAHYLDRIEASKKAGQRADRIVSQGQSIALVPAHKAS
jgi:hypothetical protein